jgi:hypothetical protein
MAKSLVSYHRPWQAQIRLVKIRGGVAENLGKTKISALLGKGSPANF